MSLRLLTDRQLSTGTALVGQDVEHALSDLEGRVNALQPADLHRRWVPVQIVAGHLPAVAAGDTLPYMPDINDAGEVAGAVTPASFENARRAKGNHIHADISDNGEAWTRTLSLATVRPLIVLQLDILLVTDSAYVNSFAYDAAPPAGRTALDPVNDVVVAITADSPFAADDRDQDSLVLIRKGFRGNAEAVTTQTPAGFADMLPNHPVQSRVGGMWIHLRDLDIPIPRDTRLRWRLTLPRWTGSNAPWGTNPVDNQVSTVVLTCLEALE